MGDTNHNTTSTSTGPSEERALSEEREDIELHDMRPMRPIDVLRHDYDVQAKRIEQVMNEKRIPLHIRPIGRIRKEIDILMQKHLTGELDYS